MAFARHFGCEAQHEAQGNEEGNVSAKKGVLVVIALTFVADIAFFVLLAPRKGFDLSFALFLCGLAVCLDEYACWSLVTGVRLERGTRARTVLLKKSARYLALALCASVLFEALTLFGAPQVSALDPNAWNLKRLAFAFFVALSAILVVKWLKTGQEKCKILHEIRRGFSTVGVKQIVAVIICAVLCVVLCVVLVSTGRSLRGSGLFSAAIFLSVSALVLSGRNMGSHPEYAVFVIIVAFGMCISLSLPAVTRVSWDDQIHYERTRAVSYVVDPVVSQAEETLTSPWVIDPTLSQVVSTEGEGAPMASVPSGFFDKTVTWSQFDFDTYENALDQKAAHGEYGIDRNASYFKYSAVGYLPAATGLWFSRVLHLPLTWQFVTGKLFSLLFYAAVCFAAIRILPRKKMLASVVALLPTNVFLASNYTYDTWVTCLLILATALVYREIVYSEVRLSGKKRGKDRHGVLVGTWAESHLFPARRHCCFVAEVEIFGQQKAARFCRLLHCHRDSGVALVCSAVRGDDWLWGRDWRHAWWCRSQLAWSGSLCLEQPPAGLQYIHVLHPGNVGFASRQRQRNEFLCVSGAVSKFPAGALRGSCASCGACVRPGQS